MGRRCIDGSRWTLRVVVLASALVLPAAGVSALDHDGQQQKELEGQARALFRAERYPEALRLYQQLHARSHHPTYLRNIGRCHQMMKQPEPAIRSFRAYLEVAPDLSASGRSEVEGFIREMEELVRQQHLLAPVATRPAEPAPAKMDLLLADRPPPPIRSRWWPWVAGGAVAAAAGLVAAFLLLRPAEGGPQCVPCDLPTRRVDFR
jgi:tetratricopeptide (TPR) repeat protein